MYNLYETICSLCIKSNIKAGKMCNDLGLSRGMMTDLKMGRKQTLSAETLSKISDYFDVSIEYLLGNEKKPLTDEDEELAEYMETLKANPGMRILFSKTKNATKADIEKVIKMLDIMKGTLDE